MADFPVSIMENPENIQSTLFQVIWTKNLQAQVQAKEYNKYYTENHFKFAKEDTDIADGTSAVTVDIPFPPNGSYLTI